MRNYKASIGMTEEKEGLAVVRVKDTNERHSMYQKMSISCLEHRLILRPDSIAFIEQLNTLQNARSKADEGKQC